MIEKISSEKFVDAAWLAGAIDGEGHVTLIHNKARRGYDAKVVINNTDPRFIAKISEIYTELDVRYFYSYVTRITEKRRDRLAISASGLNGVRKILNFSAPYMTCKKEQADLLLSYIEWRIDAGFDGAVPGFHEKAAGVYDELVRMRHQEFNIQRLQRTASRPLIVG